MAIGIIRAATIAGRGRLVGLRNTQLAADGSVQTIAGRYLLLAAEQHERVTIEKYHASNLGPRLVRSRPNTAAKPLVRAAADDQSQLSQKVMFSCA